MGFLYRGGREQREAGTAHGHHVLVIAEDREGMRGERARGHVEDRCGQLACDLVHVRDHQQQALRRCESRRQRTGLQRAVDGTGGAALTLHLDDRRHITPDVRPALAGPLVRQFRHGGRGRDRIDRAHLVQAVGDAGAGFVAVQCGHGRQRVW